ncbi:hypothetical protein G6F46_004967 [Rhizopus delemar]|nr:hypothetical protein G6F46_004967 [Rhizopus delemar]
MFFEATFVPSPPLSDANSDNLSTNEFDDHASIIEPEADKPVDHVIFVIHGIGQQTEQYGQFYEHIENLQETTRQVLQTKVPDHDVRIELIPIEWHRHIHEQVDPTLRKITLKSIPTIRLIENEYLADVLFYFSKDRGQKIIDNVTHLFNTSYQHFIENHPNFNGKIIILGYSLGGIITWDILSHQRHSLDEEEQSMYQKLDVNFTKLNFKPDYFFGLGSPIGAVLTFRGQDPRLYHPELDIQFENIFHPFDPLANKPAVLVERSIPIGPSFSFPSFPISTSLFSFFSWKQPESKAAETIYEATSDAAEEQQQPQPPNGFMSSLLQYFSKGASNDKDKQNEDDPKECWETREQLVALPEDFDKQLTSVDDLFLGQTRPLFPTRSKTYSPPYTDQCSENEDEEELKRTPLRKSMTDHDPQNKSHHLVEVLGIDGLRMEIPKNSEDKKIHKEENGDKEEGEKVQMSYKKEDKENPQQQEESIGQKNGGNGDDIWSDLNEELHKPGPAITEPGESKADVAQDATVPNSKAKEEDKMTDIEEEQKKLPGGRRIDYVLQPESVISMIANEYLIGLRAHFSYWTNKDFIWHMLRRIDNLDEIAKKKSYYFNLVNN